VKDARGVDVKVGDKIGTFAGGTNRYWVERTVAEIDEENDHGYRWQKGSIRTDTGRWVPAYNWVVVI